MFWFQLVTEVVKLKPRTAITAYISMPALPQWPVSFPSCYHNIFHAFSVTEAYFMPFWQQRLHAYNPGVRKNSSFCVWLSFCHSKKIIVSAESPAKKWVHGCEQPVSALFVTLKSPIVLFSMNWTPPAALSQCKTQRRSMCSDPTTAWKLCFLKIFFVRQLSPLLLNMALPEFFRPSPFFTQAMRCIAASESKWTWRDW